jgi:hypothetical protein
MDRKEFFQTIFGDLPDGALVEVAYGDPPNKRHWVTLQDLCEQDWPDGRDAYYGPAPRKMAGGKKENILGTRVLWADVDNVSAYRATLLPSFIVWSGHGYHLYWLLEEFINHVGRIEELNKALAADSSADHCWNANRLLRVPGTRNFRRGTPVECELRRGFRNRVYRPEDVEPLARLDEEIRSTIWTGAQSGYRSRSERDWAVVCALLNAGADDKLIKRVFSVHAVGDKYREDGDKYLDRTISKAGDRKAQPRRREFEEHDDGYYVKVKGGSRRVSTFTFHPRLLLVSIDESGTGELGEDAFVGDVSAHEYKWEDVTFTRTAFTTVARLDKETKPAAWQWLGNEGDVRALLPYLLKQLQEQGLPKTFATRVLGLHTVGERHLFVGDRTTLGAGEVWPGSMGPLVYLESGREHPVLAFDSEPPSRAFLRALQSLLPRLNEPESIWPMVGWYAAAPLKPAFEARKYRFPVLNVHGTRGSGKTTLIQEVMMPLFGQEDPKSYDANTTRFVVLSLLGASNAVPIAFSEFRFGAADKFLRYVLLSYDTGHDPRGRADQTTIDYPLSAPFSVDGEDPIADPAAKERIVPVTLHPHTVAEDSDADKAFQSLRAFDLTPFGRFYIQRALQALVDGEFDATLRRARSDVFDTFSGRLPNRTRRNFIVAWTGVLLFCRVIELDPPDCSVLRRSLRVCYDIERGRSGTLADEMVEDIANAVAVPTRRAGFKWHYDQAKRILWFQLAPAHGWWIYQRRRQNRQTLERDAIRIQLTETDFIEGPEVVEGTWMYGIKLKEASKLGLV